MSYTPGPWVADGSDFSTATWVYGADRKRICTMHPGEKDWANARLIAAAPELVEALEKVIDSFPNGRNGRFIPPQPAVIDARALLARIKGK